MLDRLTQILAPLSPAIFFERYWGKEHAHIARNSPTFYQSILNAKDVDTFLQSEQLPAALFHVVKDGKSCPAEDWSKITTAAKGTERVAKPERLFDLYMDGATLVLNQAHHAFASISLACRELTRELSFPARANVYVSPPSSQGFTKHFDDHEILVLQIMGSKHWTLYPRTGAPIEIELHAGDVLYTPRGLEHSARSEEAPSIHISLGLQPVYAFQLIEELASVARAHPDFQEPLPPDFFDSRSRAAFERKFPEQLCGLMASLSPADLVERRFRALVNQESTGWPGRFLDLLRLQEMTPETVVCARTGIVRSVELVASSVNVNFAGVKLSVPAFLRPAVDQIVGEAPFPIRRLPGLLPDAQKVELARRFVRAGLLGIVEI
jgi:ribosomal protein L16 Arg81 hydroxylase